MTNLDRLLSRLIQVIAALLTLRVAVWFFEQRAHDKEYWLIFAHVIPFLAVIFTGAFVLLVTKNWVFRRLARRTPGQRP
jgi:heme/copper-type cytochrome/quinol oxidase subunit 2